MTLSEYSQASARYTKRGLVACLVPLSIAMLCIVIYAPFEHRFEDFLLTKFSPAMAGVLVVLPMALPTGVALFSLVLLGWRAERMSGVPCPHCHKSLAGYRAVVVASKNCPHCGKRVIDEDTQSA